MPGLWFSAAELQALLTMDRLLGDLEPGVLSELIGPLRKRLEELLESGHALGRGHRAAHPHRRDRLTTGRAGAFPRPEHRVALPTPAQDPAPAPAERRSPRARGLPQRLVHYRDNWYLDAWCHKRQALRTFGVDALESAVVSDKPAKEVADESLDRHFASGYGIFAGSETQEAVLLFGAERARWVSREIWHPQQDGKLQLDGSYLLRFPYAEEPELVMDILKYGPEVQVLAPDSLRDAVAAKLRAAAALY